MAEAVKRVFQTSQGEVWVWSQPMAGPDRRPVVLWIDGAFAIPRPRSFELQAALPEAAVLNAHLPGNHCPATAVHSVAAYAQAYDELLTQVGRPAIVIGASVGGLVAMAMRSPLRRGLVLLDPPLLTAKLWPLIPAFQGWLRERPADAYLREVLDAVFGVSATGVAERDYRGLVDRLDRPTWVLFGDQALMPPRPFEETPSLLDAPERALLQAHPQVQVRVIEGIGHNVGGRALAYVRTAARDLLARTLAGDGAAT
jgi:pimeloyl-ACP methyl ester carboxylesterase